jgi:hypothetical protein
MAKLVSLVRRHGCHQSVRDNFLTFTEAFEGRVPWMYLDVRGLVTTAVGNLIDTEEDACRLEWIRPDGRPATDAEIRQEWRRVKGMTELALRGPGAAADVTELRLTEADIDALVLRRFDANTRILRRTYAEWDQWPADAQLGCHSILWSGAFFPLDSRWPKFNAAARARDWAAAAEQCHEQDWTNRRSAARNAANHELFVNAAVVEAQGLDATELYQPRDEIA